MPDLLEPVAPAVSNKDAVQATTATEAGTSIITNGRHPKPDFHVLLPDANARHNGSGKAEENSTPQSPLLSPMISTPGGSPWDSLDFDFDVQDLSVFDLVGSDWIR